MNKEGRKEYNRLYRNQLVTCPNCKIQVKKGQLSRHKQSRRCKHHNDKTVATKGGGVLPPTHQISPPNATVISNILSEINLNGEFQTMTEKINSKSKDEDKKYEHSCGAKFNERLKYCPGCGDELEA